MEETELELTLTVRLSGTADEQMADLVNALRKHAEEFYENGVYPTSKCIRDINGNMIGQLVITEG
jgi:hypothetical protein